MTTNGTSSQPQSAASRLRALLSSAGTITPCPGVYDGITARVALAQGFSCLYMTGAGTSMSRLGMPDLGLATMSDMLGNASMIASLDRRVPLIADADTGYGGPMMVARTVKAYISAGVAGLHLEDQVLAKRCGHLGGKEIVSREEYAAKIRAAVMARDEERETTGGDIVIIARTDALQTYGYEEAMERLKMALEIGADVAFLEGVTTKEQMKESCKAFEGTPVLLNMVPGGVTPKVSVEEAKGMGYRLMIFPAVAINAALTAVEGAYKELFETGDATVAAEDQQKGVKRGFNIVGLQQCIAFDAKAGGKAYAAV